MRNLPVIIPQRTLVDGNYSDYLLQPRDPGLQQDGVRVYLSVLRRRKWWVLLPIMIISPIVALILLSQKPTFEASARILLENTNPQVLNIQEVLGQDKTTGFFLTEYQMIKNEENIAELVNILRLDKKISDEKTPLEQWVGAVTAFPKQMLRSAVQTLKGSIKPESQEANSLSVDPDEVRRREAMAEVYKSLKVVPQEGEKLVDITISGLDPREVAQQANMLAEIYIRKNLEKKLEAASNAIAWLTKQTAELKQQMYDAELSLQKFRENENFISFDTEDKKSFVLERLTDLNTKYNEAHAARVDLETRLNSIISLSKSDVYNLENIPPVIDGYLIEAIRELRRNYLEREIQLVDLTKKYRARHPSVVTLKAQMDGIKRSIDSEFQKAIDTLKSEHRILRAKETSLEQELNDQKGKTLGFKNDMITYTALSRDVESYRKLYYDTMERLREIKLTQASVTNNVKVVKRAPVPLQPAPSKATTKMMLSVMLSGCLGVGLAFIREYFDNRFKGADEVEPYLQILFLGIVPHYVYSKHGAYEPVLLHDPTSLAAETYRILRTRLQAITPMPKTLIVTSAVPSEGKSTTTANLGIAFAQLGWNVLLVDADLRRPSLHRHFGRPNSEGLANVLADGVMWQAAIQETSLSTLKLLPAGFSTRNPADLLNLKAMQSLLETLRDAFDLVIFDAPLVFSIPDVEILAPKIDGALLVHAPDRCEKSSVVSAKNILERGGVKVLGIVFNNIRRKEEQRYYQYHRYYSYGNNNSHQISQGRS